VDLSAPWIEKGSAYYLEKKGSQKRGALDQVIVRPSPFSLDDGQIQNRVLFARESSRPVIDANNNNQEAPLLLLSCLICHYFFFCSGASRFDHDGGDTFWLPRLIFLFL
jgi:hypothetical protein